MYLVTMSGFFLKSNCCINSMFTIIIKNNKTNSKIKHMYYKLQFKIKQTLI